MYLIDKVFILINNLDMREPIRKFGPQWSVVVVNKNLEVKNVGRYKKMPDLDDTDKLISNSEDSVYFYTQPGDYTSLEELKERIESCSSAFEV